MKKKGTYICCERRVNQSTWKKKKGESANQRLRRKRKGRPINAKRKGKLCTWYAVSAYQVKVSLTDVVDDTAGRADNDVNSSSHLPDLRAERSASVHGKRGQLRRDAVELTLHLPISERHVKWEEEEEGRG